jgi:hypothetical protein
MAVITTAMTAPINKANRTSPDSSSALAPPEIARTSRMMGIDANTAWPAALFWMAANKSGTFTLAPRVDCNDIIMALPPTFDPVR